MHIVLACVKHYILTIFLTQRFMFTNSILEAIAPIQEFSQRTDTLGIPFKTEGEICVDRCCDFRGSIQLANSNFAVCQDLMHLEGRILGTVSKKSPHRGLVAHALSQALVKTPRDGKGVPAIYWDKETQVRNLEKVWEQFTALGNVWTRESEPTFFRQLEHARNGCLQRRHPEVPSHTSGNENWHGRINALTRGDASSLSTIILLIGDMALRHNIRLKLRNLSQPVDSPSRQFRAMTLGSPHLSLIDALLRQMEHLTGTQQPKFLDIYPDHQFGLVPLKAK